MSAQSASSIVLAYGPQGARQAAGAVVLDYSATAGRRRIATTFGAPWAKATPRAVEARAVMHATATLDPTSRAPWAQGHAQQRESRSAWVLSNHAERAVLVPWLRFTTRLQRESRTHWPTAHTAERAAQSAWGRYAGRPALTAVAPWVRAQVSDPQATAPWGRYAGRPDRTAVSAWARSRPADALRWVPWVRFGRPLDAGWGVVVEPGGPIVDEHGTVVVPVRTVYYMQNQISLMRVSGALQIPALSISMSSDVDSWAWRVEATLPSSQLDAVMPDTNGTPVVLEATVNGYPVRFLAESIGRERSFGRDRIKVSGRSPSALLADPFAVSYSFSSAAAITAQQAALNAITTPGLPYGWSINWGLTDWLLPAGVWQHQGTPLSAVLRVAEAAGAYVQSDPVLQTLHVRHRYPTAPWYWSAAAPDIVLPEAVFVREGLEMLNKPAYNEVYVGGQADGVLGHVVKTGTTGGLLAQAVTDDLITHADAAMQRGRAILSDTGRQQRVDLSLPLNNDTGLLQVGQRVNLLGGATPRLGIVRSVSVTHNMPVVRQSVGVQIHV